MQQATVRWEWIGEGWNLFTQRWMAWVVQILVFVLAILILMIPFYVIIFAGSMAASSMEHPEAPSALMFLLMLLLVPLMLALSAFLLAGAYKSAMKQLRGEPFSVGDLFSGADCFVRVLGVVLVIAILGSIGAMLCIIPAFIVQGIASSPFR